MSTVLCAKSASLVGLLVDTVELFENRTRDLKKTESRDTDHCATEKLWP